MYCLHAGSGVLYMAARVNINVLQSTDMYPKEL